MPKRITQARYDQMNGGDMVPLTCENHLDLEWYTKKLATERVGARIRPTGTRSVFYSSLNKRECYCPLAELFVSLVEDEASQKKLTPFTLVYLPVNKQPRCTQKTEIEATSPREALQIFVNRPEYSDYFVACIVQGDADSVHVTLE